MLYLCASVVLVGIGAAAPLEEESGPSELREIATVEAHVTGDLRAIVKVFIDQTNGRILTTGIDSTIKEWEGMPPKFSRVVAEIDQRFDSISFQPGGKRCVIWLTDIDIRSETQGLNNILFLLKKGQAEWSVVGDVGNKLPILQSLIGRIFWADCASRR